MTWWKLDVASNFENSGLTQQTKALFDLGQHMIAFPQNDFVKVGQIHGKPVASGSLGDHNQSGAPVGRCVDETNHAIPFQLV